MNLNDFRQKYPQYEKVPDQQLADGLYNKFYSSVPREQFDKQVGFNSAPQAQPMPQKAPPAQQAPAAPQQQTIPAPMANQRTQEPGLMDRLGSRIQKERELLSPQSDTSALHAGVTGLRGVTNVLGGAADIVGTAGSAIGKTAWDFLPDSIKKNIQDDPITKSAIMASQKVGDAYSAISNSEFMKKHPDAMSAMESLKDMASFYAAKGGIGAATGTVKALSKVPGVINKGVDAVAGAAEKGVSKLSPTYASKLSNTKIFEDPANPTPQEIRTAGSKVFEQSAKLGGQFHPALTNETLQDIQDHMLKPIGGAGGVLTKEDKAFNMSLKDYEGLKHKSLTLADVKRFDESLGKKIQVDPTTYKLTADSQKIFDLQTNMRKRFMDAQDKYVLGGAGGKAGLEALKRGRKMWSASFALDDMDRIAERAARSTDPAKAEKALYGQLADNRKRMNLYSKSEREQIRKIAKGNLAATVLRETLGNRVGSMIIGELGFGGMGGAAVGAGVSAAARAGASALEAGPKAELRRSIIDRSGIDQ